MKKLRQVTFIQKTDKFTLFEIVLEEEKFFGGVTQTTHSGYKENNSTLCFFSATGKIMHDFYKSINAILSTGEGVTIIK